MRSRYLYNFFFFCVMFVPMGLSAQVNLFNTGTATPPDSAKTTLGSSSVQQRIDELRKQGVPEDVIQGYIQQQNGQQGGNKPATSMPQDPLKPGQPSSLSPDSIAYRAIQAEKKRMKAIQDSIDAKKEEIIKEYLDEEKKRKLRSYQAALKDPNTLFGHHIFIIDDPTRNDTASYLPPDEYVIQRGDRFNVQIFGPGELFDQLEVDRDGAISRQFMGKKYVGGLTYKEAQKLLKAAYNKLVPDDSHIQISLTKNQSTISVNVVGEVKNPGAYTLPAVTNAISAIFAAQGIGELGSVRKIQVKRAGQTIKTIDLYSLLIEGKTDLTFLKNDDYIYVPTQGAIIQVQGSVRRPMRYELKEGEDVNSAIRYAGGLLYDASASNGQISRLENGKDMLIDFNVKNEGSKRLIDGDILRIRSEYRRLDMMAQVEGEVRMPGTYHWRSGRVKDLIEAGGGLTPEAYKDRAVVVRITKPGVLSYIPVNLNKLDDTTQNIRIQYLDKLVIYDQTTFRNKKYITVLGSVKKQGRFEIGANTSLKDILIMSGGLKEDAEPSTLTVTYFNQNLEAKRKAIEANNIDARETAGRIPFMVDSIFYRTNKEEPRITRTINIGENWLTNAMLDTIFMGPNQFISIESKYAFRELKLVSIEGGVNNPSKFETNDKMTLRDAIYLCGGVKEGTYIDYVDMYVPIDIKEKGNFSLATKKKELIRISLSKNWQTDTRFDSIKVKNYTRIVFHDQGEFIEKGEFEVKGLVNLPGKFEYSPQMTLKDAIYMAKGLKLEADIARIEVSSILDIENTNGEILPLKVKIRSYEIAQDWQNDPLLDSVLLHPYDQVFIRPNPDFKLQQSVIVEGEVFVPGEYLILETNEKLSTFVARAGGFTKLAFPEGAYLERPDYGKVTIRLDKAIAKPGSRYDITMRKNDRLVIPELPEVVTIYGNVFKDSTSIMFDPSQTKFKYYVDLAGGFERRTRVGGCTVQYPNGTVKKVQTYFFIRKYPKITQGAVINVPNKDDGKDAQSQVDTKLKFNEMVQNVIGTTTSILTLVILIRAATK